MFTVERPVPACAFPGGACSWSHHGFKHFGHEGMTRGQTRHPLPAKYLLHVHVQAVETATVAGVERKAIGALAAKTEYLRATGVVIGWDDGQDATLSYVECSGGAAVRTFHGRPMHPGNRTVRKFP